MSLKRMPSVGKFLMSRIFDLSVATSIARYLNPIAAMRQGPKCPRSGGTLTPATRKRMGARDAIHLDGRAKPTDFPLRDRRGTRRGTRLAEPRRQRPLR